MEETFICKGCKRDDYDYNYDSSRPVRKNKYFFSDEELGKSDSERLCLECVFNSKQPICTKHCTTCTCEPERFPGVVNPFCMSSPPHTLDNIFDKYPSLSPNDVLPGGWVESGPFFQKLGKTNRLWCLNLKFLTGEGERKTFVLAGCHRCRNTGFNSNIGLRGCIKILKVKLFLKGFGK